MGLYKKGDKRLHHVHIPKTAGTSIAHLLQSQGWVRIDIPPLPEYMKNEIGSREPYTHIHHAVWKLWDQTWDYEFTTVRNPYERLVSQCRQIINARKASALTPQGVIDLFNEAHNEYIPNLGKGFDDNHFRPQVEFISDKTTVFKLEDQGEMLVNFLKENDIISEECSLPKKNVSMEGAPHLVVHWPLCPLLHKQFLNLYGKDFDMFGYSREVPTHGLKINWDKANEDTSG